MRNEQTAKAFVWIGSLFVPFFIYFWLTRQEVPARWLALSVALTGALLAIALKRRFQDRKYIWIVILSTTGFRFLLEVTQLILLGMGQATSTVGQSIELLHVLPTIALCVGLIIFFILNRRQWQEAQMLLDMSVLLLFLLILILTITTRQLENRVSGILTRAQLFTALVLNTIGLAVILTIMLVPHRRRHGHHEHWAMISGLLFIVMDLLYYLMFTLIPGATEGMVHPTIISFPAFGVTILSDLRESAQVSAPAVGNATQDRRGNALRISLWLMSIIAFIVFILGLLDRNSVFFLAIVLIGYFLIGRNIQRAQLMEFKYLQSRADTDRLDGEVRRKTQELVDANTSLRALNLELFRQSRTDPLTGLGNRLKHLEDIDLRIAGGLPFTLLFLDLNRLKVINDLHGPQIGDQVLQTVAERLSSLAPEIHIARMGGDEFGLLVDGISSLRLRELTARIFAMIDEICFVGQHSFTVSANIGYARYPDDADTVNDLLRCADLALTHAKSRLRGGTAVLYSPLLTERIERRNRIDSLLRGTDFDQTMRLLYQPQFNVKDRRLIGMEALLRWTEPEYGPIPPDEFIPIAEESGLIVPLSDWVFAAGMKQIAQWNCTYGRNLKLGINLSPLLLQQPGFFGRLRSGMEEQQIVSSWLEVEITEHNSALIATYAEDAFTRLRDAGVAVAIDDFGIGYSSLAYLTKFNIQRLKIARELIENIDRSISSRLIVRAIVMMADGLGISTVAEGVETQEQLAILTELHCDALQGFLWGHPLDAQSFERAYLNPDRGLQ